MAIKIKDVTHVNFNEIPSPSPGVSCKSCDFWEGGSSLPGPDALMKEESKKSRISQKVIHAKILYGDGRAIGYSQYGRTTAFPVVWPGVHNLEPLLRKKGSL